MNMFRNLWVNFWQPSRRPRGVVLCRWGVVLAAGAYCMLTVAALAVLLHHRDPLYLMFLAGYLVLAGLFLSKLGKKPKPRRRSRRSAGAPPKPDETEHSEKPPADSKDEQHEYPATRLKEVSSPKDERK